ncbi:sensor histidine kinase [Desertivirga arenae]|uniref:sensor histidine kinase n=1 Tax=Desertivirga arenae TaxID=2810309 RepID=UPI001A9765D5|nr:HAMP domain-containing sensor histidine kinase [Pedobacter sp. SYSU D00823]
MKLHYFSASQVSMNVSGKFYTAIAVLCFIVLLYIHYILIFNTYELKNKQYNLEEKVILNEAYGGSIPNDKVYPGGQRVLDKYINQNIRRFELLHKTRPTAFDQLARRVCDSVFAELRAKSVMDSLFREIIKKYNLSKELRYLLTIEKLSVTFDGNNYHTLYPFSKGAPNNPYKYTSAEGVIIDGSLAAPDKQNEVSTVSVTTPEAYSYQITFSLFADYDNRTMKIIRDMSPTFLLSLSSILFVVGIYFFTYRNWQRQKKLSEMKTDFLNSITHEFNTPLSTILVANKSLQNPEIIENRDNVYNLAEVIQRQATRLQALINLALDITAMPSRNLQKEIYDFNSLISEIIEDYKIKCQNKVQISFNKEIARENVLLDRFLFTTTLYNLFDNAVKYNRAQNKQIQIETKYEGDFVVLSIEDNGIGIPTMIKNQVFDKFYRGKNEIGAGGLGLGLFYVRQSIDAHGWSIKINSEHENGSKFSIFIPRMREIKPNEV